MPTGIETRRMERALVSAMKASQLAEREEEETSARETAGRVGRRRGRSGGVKVYRSDRREEQEAAARKKADDV